MNEPLYNPHLFENNPHYESILQLLSDETESIVQGCENRKLLANNAEDTSMDEEEYREFLLDFYFSTWDERKILMEKFIRSVSVWFAVKQYCKTKGLALDVLQNMRQEK